MALAIGACAAASAACGEPVAVTGPDATLEAVAQATTTPGPAPAPEPAGSAASLAPSEGGVADLQGPSEDRSAGDASALDGGAACPEGMIAVDTEYCPDVDRTCIDAEHDDINNLDICHAFAHHQRCRLRPRRIAFCIDQYEYPNVKGAHPTWMIDWYQAQATCESEGKRLCYASEWTAACEGPAHTPFPYGWERDHDKCNIDNFFIEPKKWAPKGNFLFYSHIPEIARPELERLDESVPSGSIASCVSGYGVNDLTGNVDEWVVSDVAPRERSKWSGLKGGAWGHVRSQCRPMTYSHDPGFAYYFVGFRCCADLPGAPRWKPSGQATPPPDVEPHDFAPTPIVVEHPSGPSKSKFFRKGHWGHAE
ncbi:MAG TPA: SUMF1/EgtB/PvdO family nonheme iron enzyme [Polyangiaceae bacterium]|nr:SUMF1/EgtB/PvdO family nonheme iron enzyme [Polyangiaceae bacterium]